MKTGIVLAAHGSRESSANEDLVRISELLERHSEYTIVQPAYLELAKPDIAGGIDMCIEKGADRILIVPYFLIPGSHVKEDLAQVAAEARVKHPGISISLADPIGYHPILADIVLDRVTAILNPDPKEEEIP